MNDLIEFLDKRHNMKQQDKEKLYFNQFCQKPTKWLKENEPEQYQMVMLQEEKRRKILSSKRDLRLEDPEYLKVTARLRKEFRKSQKKKHSKK